MIKTLRPLFLLLILTFLAAGPTFAKGSGDGLWREVSETSALRSSERSVVPEKYRTFQLDNTMLRTVLDSAPKEFTDPFGMSNTIMTLPMPDGTYQRFRIENSLVVEPALLEKFPELAMTFKGQGIDDPSATVRFDILPNGFHSMILSPQGTVMVDPYSRNNTSTYISYFKRDVQRTEGFACGFEGEQAIQSLSKPKKTGFESFIPDTASAIAAPSVSSGTQLRTYRLALAATGEYTATAGGTIAGALAAQVVIMNRVNGVYERELAIRMVIIGNNNLIVYTNGGTDPYTNDAADPRDLLDENQANVDAVIGLANYDIGHVFSTGGGGVAGLSVSCGPNKARGETGLSNPTGDVFAIDFVAHEMGHQWGANHTFNGNTINCAGGNRSANSAYEPGSGVTIMGYAGICGNQDLAGNSIDTFHVKSLEDIIAFSQTGNGNTCAQTTATGNTPPTVTSVGGNTFNIPKLTPFTLAASATDVNGDTVTYDWQQYDLGAATTAVPNTDSDGNARPLFRSYSPTSAATRTFPKNQFILANANIPPNLTGGFMTGELLPSIARTMNFQVIARDNHAGGGGISTASVQVVVAGTGPFQVTSPALGTTWYLGTNPVVTWNTGGSNAAPINAANVRILLSTDGGATFPTVLAANTPNDGSEAVVSPAINSTTARIRIEPIGNIFFDVSDANFTISNQAPTTGLIAGRVATVGGRGVGRVYVKISGGNLASPRLALTNMFGYFSFGEVDLNQTYTLTPARKGTVFNPVSVVRTHNAAAADVNFTIN